MATREHLDYVQVHDCCVVPYRLTPSGVEFCLVTPVAENRWEFPKAAVLDGQSSHARLLARAAGLAGLHGEVEGEEPLGFYAATRGNEQRSMTGYLMRVERVDDDWPLQATHKRLWCLAEEGRARIRRKPLRRFIDLALHSAEVDLARHGSRGLSN